MSLNWTIEQLKSWIDATFPDNVSRSITEADLRDVLKKTVDWVFETNSSGTVLEALAETLNARDQTVQERILAQQAIANAILGQNPLGEYDVANNTPALLQVPAAGIPVGSYYDITAEGAVAFSGSNFASAAVLAIGGRLIKKDSTAWYYQPPSNLALAKAILLESSLGGEVQEGDTRMVSGEKVLSYIVAAGLPLFDYSTGNEVIGASTTGMIWQYESSTFSGHGSSVGAWGTFDRIRFKLRGWKSDELPTLVTVRLRTNDRTGDILFEKTFPFTTGVPDDLVEIDTGLIDHSGPMWFEYLTNGRVGAYSKSGTIPGDALGGYVINKNPSGAITATYSTNARTWVEFVKSTKTYKLTEFGKQAISQQLIIDKSQRPYFGPKEETKFTSIPATGLNFDTELSTFSGWGCGIGAYTGTFDRIRFKLRGWKSDELPTLVRVRIRENDYDGTIIIDKLVSFTTDANNYITIYLDNVTVAGQLYFEYLTDGRVGKFGSLSSVNVGQPGDMRYATAKNVNQPTLGTVVTSGKKQILHVILSQSVPNEYMLLPEGKTLLKEELAIGSIPSILLNTKTVLFPGLEYNIYNANLLVSAYGDHSDSSIDYSGSYGAQKLRGYRYSAVAGHNFNLNVRVTKLGNEVSKIQNIVVAAAASGNGVTRKVLIIGDSTVNGSNISTPLKTVFDPDVMNINLIGTLGGAGVKHEGRGGWTINDYYGFGRALYVFNVSGITTPPAIGATYTHNAVTYTIVEVNLSGGAGYFSASGASAPLATGTLTKATGAGDATITFSSSSSTSTNPFYNPSTEHFDMGYYLTQTGQSLSAGDWVFFQLGINDVFSQATISGAEAKVAQMLGQMDYIVSNIRTYNSSIRIGIVVTFPPANQDSFGANYGNAQTNEIYRQTGLLTWQKALMATYDNDIARGNNIHLVPAHLNLDCDYNYPTVNEAVNARNATYISAQSNSVHPASSGYAQIADMYAGLIKYFG